MNNRRWIVLGLVALVALPGCRSGAWKMPGSSLLSWGRKPDASTLSGEDELPQLPPSPAAKYDPGTIASVGAKNTPATGGSTNQGSGTAYGYSAQTVSTPKTGLAAQANGYQTGPYQMGTASTTGTAPSGTTAAAGLPNPYGGSYTGTAGTSASAQAPNIALPTSVTNTLATGSAASPAGYPGASAPAMGSAGTASSIPVGYPQSSPASATPTMPSTTTTPDLPSYPSLPAGGVGGTPSPSAYQGATTLTPTDPSAPATASAPAGFAPGTTGRSTGYDFGAGSSNSLPPNTASGSVPLLR